MTELPTWIDDRIESRSTKKVRQELVVEIFINSERPFLSTGKVFSKVLEELEGTANRGTVENRLNELVEIDVLDSMMAGDSLIYWIRNEKSKWPIPPDVEVEPVSNEMTVREFFSDGLVQAAGVGLGFIFLSSLLFFAGAFMEAYDWMYLGLTPANTIFVGFICILIGWSFFFFAVALWLSNRPILTK